MVKKKIFKKKNKIYKKYSLSDRYDYHSSRANRAFSKAKDSESATKLFKNRRIAYSVGYTDGIDGNTQFSTIAKYGGDEKAYGAGVDAGVKVLNKSRKVKF